MLPADNHLVKNSLAANPYFFSSRSRVRDSGVSIPTKRIRSFLSHTPKPKSISTSTVSPSFRMAVVAVFQALQSSAGAHGAGA